METQLLKDAWLRICEAESIVLATHVRPDGDCLGSALCLSHILKKMGKRVLVLCEDGVPEIYNFIPESETMSTVSDGFVYDLGVLVDCESVSRIGNVKDAITNAKSSACVDHHVPNDEYGDIRVTNTDSSSTAEVIYELLYANQVEIDLVSAKQLMTGIIADTGAFRFPNTSARTFEIASKLTEIGVSPSEIARNVYESKPLRTMKLLGKTLSSLDTDPNGLVVWGMISYDDLQYFEATDADTDGLVNHVSSVYGPKVALLLRESQPGSVRVSLRSKGEIDVNKIAQVFGGGGHKAASGCTINDSLENAQKMLVNEVLKWMV